MSGSKVVAKSLDSITRHVTSCRWSVDSNPTCSAMHICWIRRGSDLEGSPAGGVASGVSSDSGQFMFWGFEVPSMDLLSLVEVCGTPMVYGSVRLAMSRRFRQNIGEDGCWPCGLPFVRTPVSRLPLSQIGFFLWWAMGFSTCALARSCCASKLRGCGSCLRPACGLHGGVVAVHDASQEALGRTALLSRLDMVYVRAHELDVDRRPSRFVHTLAVAARPGHTEVGDRPSSLGHGVGGGRGRKLCGPTTQTAGWRRSAPQHGGRPPRP